MKVKLQSLLCLFLLVVSAMAGCLDSENTTDEDENDINNENDPTNNTDNSTDNITDNNTGNNIENNTGNNTGNNIDNNTGNNTDNNTGNNTDNNSNNPCQPNYDTNASNLPDGACCSSGGQCASMNCNYNNWTCEAWDSDGDGMDDSWEESFNLDPNNASDSDGDPDNDNLTNLQEYQNGTNPNQSDSDGDGLIDSEDPNPNYPDNFDADSDGWTDDEETNCGTDPNDNASVPNDANQDGICDAMEDQFSISISDNGETLRMGEPEELHIVATIEGLDSATEYVIDVILSDGNTNIIMDNYLLDESDNGVHTYNESFTGGNGYQDANTGEWVHHLDEGEICWDISVYLYDGNSLTPPSGGIVGSDGSCFDVLPAFDIDDDQDGFNTTVDCDDNNPNVNPDEDEIWNGIDDNCDGIIDEFQASVGNASFDMGWNTVGWNIDHSDAEYKGHNLYWLTANHFAYRFLSSQDQVFDWGSACSVDNFANSVNIDATLAALNADASNITISMSTMDLGTDTEGTEWSYNQNTYIETRHYDGGTFILMFDDQPFLNVSLGFTQYLNYSDYFVGAPNPQVTMNGSSSVAEFVNGIDQATEPNLWRIAEAFIVDFNSNISFTYDSQEAIIQTEYEEQRAEAMTLGVIDEITDLLVVGDSTPEWVAAQFTEFEAVASSED